MIFKTFFVVLLRLLTQKIYILCSKHHCVYIGILHFAVMNLFFKK